MFLSDFPQEYPYPFRYRDKRLLAHHARSRLSLMATQIHITQLRPGMRIEKLDRSWFETPFFRQRMAVSSMKQVENLKACGVETLGVSGEIDGDTNPIEEAGPEPAAPTATPTVSAYRRICPQNHSTKNCRRSSAFMWQPGMS